LIGNGINKNLLKVYVDNYPARKDIGLYNIADRGKDIAEKGQQTALKAASFYAETGDKLRDFENYRIADLAEEIMYTEERELTLKFKRGPNIDVRA